MIRVSDRLALAGWALCLATACVPIPYKPSATVATDPAAEMPVALVARAQEDDAVRTLARKIHSMDDQLVVVSLRELGDIAFAEGDCTIELLVGADRRDRLRKYLGLSYLVLVGDLAESEQTRHGGFIPLLGAGTYSGTTRASATVVDLLDGRLLSGIDSSTSASGGGVIYGFFGVFVVPMSESSVYDGITKGVVAAIRSRSGEGPLRIAVLHVSAPLAPDCADAADCPQEQPVPDATVPPAPVPTGGPGDGDTGVSPTADRVPQEQAAPAIS